MRQRAKRDYRPDILTAEKRKSRWEVEGWYLTCALRLEKNGFIVCICVHIKGLHLAKYKETVTARENWKLSLLCFFGLSEYVVLLNLHWSLKRAQLLTSSLFISVKGVLSSHPPHPHTTPEAVKPCDLNMPIGFKYSHVYFLGRMLFFGRLWLIG